MKDERISLAHGDGGEKTNQLIKRLFVTAFGHGEAAKFDAAPLEIPASHIAISTDSFVVDPIQFPGGDIGKLAVAGTVNDLAVSKAVPKWLTAGFIIEEGFPFETLQTIVQSMAKEAEAAGVKIVAGDTKVVEKGACDGIFINTTGIGVYEDVTPSHPKLEEGDAIIVNGTIGDHGMALMAVRKDLPIKSDLLSDCASLNQLIFKIIDRFGDKVKFMRDATRGGLASTLIEVCDDFHTSILLDEEKIPVDSRVKGACALLGYNPLFVANEGKILLVVDKSIVEEILQLMKEDPLGRNAAEIGKVKGIEAGSLTMLTELGTEKKINRLSSIQLPRIC
ncbi:MAG: hydrogenase expression/formation protein HypE [Bacillus sp. (in: Bacteria)]|nr:hydrogenase expression/formation protein HypE [Bacillus sp. (in: firmicutes)]